jgi:hypothetical protein
MKKWYAVSVTFKSKGSESAFVDFCRNEKLAWWHWLPGFWLVRDNKGKVKPSSIRDAIGGIEPTARCIVLPIKPERGWAGQGPSADNNDMFKWLRSNWKQDEQD